MSRNRRSASCNMCVNVWGLVGSCLGSSDVGKYIKTHEHIKSMPWLPTSQTVRPKCVVMTCTTALIKFSVHDKHHRPYSTQRLLHKASVFPVSSILTLKTLDSNLWIIHLTWLRLRQSYHKMIVSRNLRYALRHQ